MIMGQNEQENARVLLLTTVRSYRLEAFRKAAERLGVEIVNGVDLPEALADQWPDALPLAFGDVAGSVRRIVAYAADHPLTAVLAVDDSGSLIAAAASHALGLPHNNPAAAEAARDKSLMRVTVVSSPCMTALRSALEIMFS